MRFQVPLEGTDTQTNIAGAGAEAGELAPSVRASIQLHQCWFKWVDFSPLPALPTNVPSHPAAPPTQGIWPG